MFYDGLPEPERRDRIHRLTNVLDKIILVIRPRHDYNYYNSGLYKAYTKRKIAPDEIVAAVVHTTLTQNYPDKIETLKEKRIRIYTIK